VITSPQELACLVLSAGKAALQALARYDCL
jgi:hypothetical protein